MFFVYVLKSLSADLRYVGMTSDLEKRVDQHNKGKSAFTSKFTPWELVHSEKHESKEEARSREKYLKSAAGRRYLNKILSDG